MSVTVTTDSPDSTRRHMVSLTMLSSTTTNSSTNPPLITTSAEGSISTGWLIMVPALKYLRKGPFWTRLEATGPTVKLTPAVPLSARANASAVSVLSTTATTPSADRAISSRTARPRPNSARAVSGVGCSAAQVALQMGTAFPSRNTCLPWALRRTPQKRSPAPHAPCRSHMVSLAAQKCLRPGHSTSPSPHPFHWMPSSAHARRFSAHVTPSAHSVFVGAVHTSPPSTHSASCFWHFQSGQRRGRTAGHSWLTTVHGIVLRMQPSTSQNCSFAPHCSLRLSRMSRRTVLFPP
mmetsp:Transcript_38424/g.76962  ORF Transcript_38424/g.76962 Transcript_38424/m.76962 type:complete len:293 (-) Transcript_38424:102-980(-)